MPEIMTPEQYQERRMEIGGWEIRLSSYRLGAEFYCRVDNVSPGATVARTKAATREEAEQKALERARDLLARTHRRAV